MGSEMCIRDRGKTVKPFAYLEEADFVILEEGLGMAIGQCMADQS